MSVLLILAALPAALSAWRHLESPAGGGALVNDEVATMEVAASRNSPAPILWVDARKPESFALGHIPGAFNLNDRSWEEQLGAFIEKWRPGIRVVVYCDGAGCDASRSVARRLRRELDIRDVHVLAGGWEAWQRETKR